MIQTYRINHPSMRCALHSRNGENCGTVLGIQKTIPQRSATTGSSTGSLHLGIQRAIHPIPEHAPQGNKIWVGD